MDLLRKNLPLTLVRPHLNDLPAPVLPPDYSWRWFRYGDAAHWLHIHHDADPFNDICPELFTRQFGMDFKHLANRQLYVQDPIGRVVGTGTAWSDETRPDGPCGRVYWLAVLRQFQGLALGKAILAAICIRLRELGYSRACVVTSTGRLPAVNLYLQFGFQPEMPTTEDRITWEHVCHALESRRHGSAAAAA